jgi:hypothetical protein
MPSHGRRLSTEAQPVLRSHLTLTVALFFALGPASGTTPAQERSNPEPAKNQTGSVPPVGASASRPATPRFKILKVEPSEAEIGKSITVELSGFEPAWMAGDKLMTDKLVVVLDNLELKGLRPIRMGDSHKLVFQLESNPDLAPVWARLLTEPMSRTRVLPLAVGVEGLPESRVFAETGAFQIVLIPMYRLLISLALAVLSVGLFIPLATRTAILRDTCSCDLPSTLRTYSLARTQMAFWYLLVVAAFLFSWAVLGDYPTIPGPVLSLIGIASGTALGAAVIEVAKTNPNSVARADLKARQAILEVDVKKAADQLAQARADLDARSSASADVRFNLEAAVTQATGLLDQKQAELNDVAKQLASGESRTQGFVLDILTDDTGISLHRFQMAVWTTVLGVLFVIGVWQKFRMPEFDPTLLALMGISSGTYLGFKIPEKPT